MLDALRGRIARRLGRPFVERTEELLERSLVLQGKAAAEHVRLIDRVDSIRDIEFRVFSQHGEDGILEWILQRLPVTNRRFIEFGVESYTEANTRFLLVNRNWKGLVIDGSSERVAAITRDAIYWRHDLTAVSAFVSCENINHLFREAGFEGEVGVLSIDIDGNDYWVWESISIVTPAIVVCEYNAIFGDEQAISIPYNPVFERRGAHSSCQYFGASIAALIQLAKRKGYVFLGSNLNANDAFFVRSDLADHLCSRIEHRTALPSFFRDSRDVSGALSFVGGLNRLDIIKNMPVVRVETGETVRLSEIENPYSQQWLDLIQTGGSH